jgi:hypothetical protein
MTSTQFINYSSISFIAFCFLAFSSSSACGICSLRNLPLVYPFTLVNESARKREYHSHFLNRLKFGIISWSTLLLRWGTMDGHTWYSIGCVHIHDLRND